MFKYFSFVFILFCFLASCQNESKNIELDFSDLKETLSTYETNSIVNKNSLYKVIISHNKRESDIWISSPKKEIYDSILEFYNQKFQTNLSDSVFNSWTNSSKEIILFRESDSLVLVTVYKS